MKPTDAHLVAGLRAVFNQRTGKTMKCSNESCEDMQKEKNRQIKEAEERIFMEIFELPANERRKLLIGAGCHRSNTEKEAEEALYILLNSIAVFLTNTWIGNRLFICFLHVFHFHKTTDRTGFMICLFSLLWLLLSVKLLFKWSTC